MSPTGKPVSPITIPTYAKASVGHPPVGEIRRSMWMHCRDDSTQSYAFLHGQGRGLLRRRMRIKREEFLSSLLKFTLSFLQEASSVFLREQVSNPSSEARLLPHPL